LTVSMFHSTYPHMKSPPMNTLMNRLVKLAICSIILVLCSLGMAGEVSGEDPGAYYWAQGRKIYVDPISEYYLAMYGPKKESRSPSPNHTEKTLNILETPPEIQLPPNTSLVRVGGSLYYRREPLDQRGGRLRALIQAYSDRQSGAMVLPTDRIIVRFQLGVDEGMARNILEGIGLVDIDNYPNVPGQFMARLPATDSYLNPLEAANQLYERPEVIFCHPDMIKEKIPTFVPNDTFYYDQWHLHNEGQGGGKPGADIHVEEAWNVTLGSPEVRVGIMDNGIMKDHEDLSPNYVIGKNFLTGGNDPTPSPESGPFGDWHGTATAGLAVARGNNGKGISGVCPECALVAVRYGSASSDDANAFYWQNQQGVAVSSNSWGYADDVMPDVLYHAIQDVALNGRNGLGMLVLVASGNEGRPIPSTALAAHPNVLAVGASTYKDIRASYSNYGSSLSIVAPSSGGMHNISSTDVYPPVGDGYNPGGSLAAPNYSNGRYTNDFGGTSASCPQVAGVVGLMLTANADLPRLAVKRALEYTADKVGTAPYVEGKNSFYGYGRVNAVKALWAALVSNYTGWWYTPTEVGSGISIETQGLALFLTWFGYDAQSGEPTWLTSGAVMADAYHYAGPLLRWTGWPLGGSYSPPQAFPVGTIRITFSSNAEALLSWTLGASQGQKTIRKFMADLSPGSKDTRDIHGWWYNPDVAGMGLFMEAKGGNLFIGWHHYGPDGLPRWWSSAYPFPDNATTYSGIFDEWKNGQCIGCISYISPELVSHPTWVSIQFLGESEAILNWEGGQLYLERFYFGGLE
jgi:hypothetical protein